MVSVHANAIRIRQMFAAFRVGDVATIRELIPDDAVWHFPGRHGQLAGTHRGRDAIFAFLLNVQALTNGTFHLDLMDVLANDENAVALFRGHGQRNGKTLDQKSSTAYRSQTNSHTSTIWPAWLRRIRRQVGLS